MQSDQPKRRRHDYKKVQLDNRKKTWAQKKYKMTKHTRSGMQSDAIFSSKDLHKDGYASISSRKHFGLVSQWTTADFIVPPPGPGCLTGWIDTLCS